MYGNHDNFRNYRESVEVRILSILTSLKKILFVSQKNNHVFYQLFF